jgi:hypothetical protein
MIVRDNDILPHEARSMKHDKESFVCEDVSASKSKPPPKDSAAAAGRPSWVGFGVLRISDKTWREGLGSWRVVPHACSNDLNTD